MLHYICTDIEHTIKITCLSIKHPQWSNLIFFLTINACPSVHIPAQGPVKIQLSKPHNFHFQRNEFLTQHKCLQTLKT